MNISRWARVSCLGSALLLLAVGCPTKTAKNSGHGAADGSPRAAPSSDIRPSSSLAYYGYRLIREYPHDPCSFTQGLVYENGFLYEGTGLYSQSRLIKRNFVRSNDYVPLAVVRQVQLERRFFGEGIALVGDRIIQLTWQEHTGFVYDKNTFQQSGRFDITTEGWGLTYDGQRLILSDGSSNLYFLDPNSFSEIGRLRVTERGLPIRYINELEYVDDPAFLQTLQKTDRAPSPVVLANILGDNRIVMISPQTGNVTGVIDLTGIYTHPPGDDENHVLNGIAYLPDSKHLLVTGKCWTKMFEISLRPLE